MSDRAKLAMIIYWSFSIGVLTAMAGTVLHAPDALSMALGWLIGMTGAYGITRLP